MSQQRTSIQISFGKLAVLIGDSERQPLSALNHGCHIHGQLEIRVGNRIVPYMGYFGPNDVCFSDWINELDGVLKEFEGKDTASYLFDEGEQSQPAYLFEREHGRVFLSIIDSELSDGEGDEEWQRAEFNYNEFVEQVNNFKANFLNKLKLAAPTEYRKWVASSLRR